MYDFVGHYMNSWLLLQVNWKTSTKFKQRNNITSSAHSQVIEARVGEDQLRGCSYKYIPEHTRIAIHS